ncbi:hypothetical protein ACW9H6_27570 [Pseudomonas sp. SDO528_S397]
MLGILKNNPSNLKNRHIKCITVFIACIAVAPLSASATDYISGKLVFQDTNKESGVFGVKQPDGSTMTLLVNPRAESGDPHRWEEEADLMAQAELLDDVVVPAQYQTGPITRKQTPQLCLFAMGTHAPVLWFQSDAKDCPQWTNEGEGRISTALGNQVDWLTYTGRSVGKPDLSNSKTQVIIRTDLMTPFTP